MYRVVTVAARRHENDREKAGWALRAGILGRKRRKYQRDRYKYGAIYDSLMYSWIFIRREMLLPRHRMNLRYVGLRLRGKLAVESIPWFMPRLSFSDVTYFHRFPLVCLFFFLSYEICYERSLTRLICGIIAGREVCVSYCSLEQQPTICFFLLQ